jgi:hypothetical protein
MSRPASWLILSCVLVGGAAATADSAVAQERPLNLSIPKEAAGRGYFGPAAPERLALDNAGGGGAASAQAGEARGGGMPFGAGYEARRGAGGGLGGPMGGGAGRGRR